jgi:hypothetical protein
MVAVDAAAAAVHDQAIGVHNVHHLFRLPDAWEFALDRCRRGLGRGHMAPNDASEALAVLTRIAGQTGSLSAGERGAVRMGAVPQLQSERVRATVAAGYVAAFTGGYRLYPFFSAVP